MIMMEEVKKSANRLKKERLVEEFSAEISKYPVVALFTLNALPAKYLQMAKSKLRGKARFMISKSAVIKRALQKAGIPETLYSDLEGAHGIILTDMSPFKLFKELKNSRGQAYAKPGQVALADIVVPAGETQFPAGPVLSEFKQAGLDVKIEGGKIHITKDKVLVKEGEEISDNVAKILQKLDIKPFEIGVELERAYRSGVIYDRSVLDVNEQEYLNNLVKAFSDARALSVEIAFPTKENIELLLVKAYSNARNLAVNESILEKDVLDLILAKAQANANAIKTLIGG